MHMSALHTFGCSITQGFALPDVVKPLLDSTGTALTPQQLHALEQQGQTINWEDIHVYQPSALAWPQLLGNRLNLTVHNHARRGACFQQIARQCAVAHSQIQPGDVVIVMWTYLSRLSLQWPTRTAVPFCHVVRPEMGWITTMRSQLNRAMGLSDSHSESQHADIKQFIQHTAHHSLHELHTYDRYHNQLLLLSMTDGFLQHTGARIIHLSVEPQPYLEQLELARQCLPSSLQNHVRTPHPTAWYRVNVDHDSCRVILNPLIPCAENDMHPSVQHHENFADHIHQQYFVPKKCCDN